jgi:hypothetical protein
MFSARAALCASTILRRACRSSVVKSSEMVIFDPPIYQYLLKSTGNINSKNKPCQLLQHCTKRRFSRRGLKTDKMILGDSEIDDLEEIQVS